MFPTQHDRRLSRRSLVRRALSGLLSLVLVVTMLEVIRYSTPQTPLSVQREPVVAGKVAKPIAVPPAVTGTPYTPGRVSWPSATTVDVDVPPQGVRVAGLPIRLAPAPGASAPKRVRVRLADRKAAQDAGVSGLLLDLGQLDGGTQPGRLNVTVDYTGFRHAYGGDWSNRLGFVDLDDPADVPPVTNDVKAGTVSAVVEVAPQATGGSSLGLTAAPKGKTGDYTATSLSPSATWSAGSNTGDFNWSYPVRTPPGVGGPEPGIALSYNSASVDGRVAVSNNQPSWIGQGFEFDPGFIERRYTSCSEDQDGGNNTAEKTGDQCWATDNATLSMSGHAGELIKEAGNNDRWHLRGEDGTRVERRYSAGNGARNGEHWVVTTTNGVQFWFGRSPQATLTVPVAGNQPNEPCRATAFKDSFCTQAYRWSLDYVVDPHNNTMTYFYVEEFNKYARNNKTTEDPVGYDRANYLDRIEYGTRTDTTGAPFMVKFDVADRCLSNCADKANWFDIPQDQECTAKPCTNTAPTFWSTKRLTKITSWVGADDVESWTLHQSFPDPGDSTRPGLWLDRIEHKGHVGGQESVPDISFVGVQLNNRVDTDDHSPPMNWWRVKTINTESGGKIDLTYSNRDCVVGSRMPSAAALQNNTLRCYPVKWTPQGATEPVTDFFHKYVVTDVTETDLTGGSPRVITHYDYVGDPAWHYTDEDGLTKEKDKTWSGWRGYGTVRMTKGDPGEQTSVETRFFRGMHGDKLPTGTRTVQLPAIATGNVPAVNDEDQYAGMPRETITYNGPGGLEVSAEVSEPWRSPPTASRTTNGITVEARHVNTAVAHTRTARDGGRSPLTTSVATTFDNTYGFPTRVEDRGTPAAGDEQCTLTDAVSNTTAWVIGAPSRERKFAVDCTRAQGAGLTDDDVLGDDRTFYDSQAFGQAPTKGLVTRTEGLAAYNGGNPAYYRKTVQTFDEHGRTASLTDLKGTTTTEYTPAKGGPVTQTIGKNALGWATTTTFAPAWNLPLDTRDVNGRRTSMDYDPFGRLTAVWLAGRDKETQSPNTTYTYRMRNNAATTVTMNKLNPRGGYITSYSLYDGLLRPRQSQKFDAAGSGNGVFTDAFYDTAGREVRTNDEYLGGVAPNGNLYIPTSVIPGQTTTVYDGAGRTTAEVFKLDAPSGGSPGGTEKWRTVTRYGGDHTHLIPPYNSDLAGTTAPAANTATTTIVDALGRTTELRQYHPNVPVGSEDPTHFDTTTYEYNRKDQLIKVTDPARTEWRYGYDLRGRQNLVVDPDKGTATTTYTDADEPLTVTDGNGHTLAYTYDELGRKTSLRDDSTTGPLRAEWAYDTTFNNTSVKGHLVRSTRWVDGNAYTKENRTFTAGYDPTSVRYTIPDSERGLAGTYEYIYFFHPDGSPRAQRSPAIGDVAAETIYFEYDGQGRQVKLNSGYGSTGSVTSLVESTEFTSFGEIGKVVLRNEMGNTVDIVRQYEAGTRRLTQIRTDKQLAPTAVADLRYGYDLAGNVTNITDTVSGDTQCFTVDHLRRLTEAWTPGNGNCDPNTRTTANLGGPAKYWHSYRYDPVGNRTNLVEHGLPSGDRTTDYTTPAGQHALDSTTTRYNGATTTAGFTYDDTGNLTSRPTPTSGKQVLTWDREGSLATATDTSGTTAFRYDADGTRLIRDDPTGKTLYLPGQELRYTKGAGAKTCTRYYTFAGNTVAMRTSEGLSWLSADHHGTTGITIAALQQEVSTRRETPFGVERSAGGTMPTGFDKGFVGGTKDNTGLTSLGARSYDPALGRFISVDPVIDNTDPQQLHGYAYGNNNPLTFNDPDGRFSLGGALKKAGNNIVSGAKSAGNFVKNVAVDTVKSIKQDPLKFATGLVVGIAVAVAVGAVCATGVGCLILAGAVAGAAAAGAEYGVDVAQGEKEFSTTELGKEMAVGAVVGGLSAGAGVAGGKALDKAAKSLRKGNDVAEEAAEGGANAARQRPEGCADGPALSTPFHSFAPGTPVLMADGTTKPIGEIEIGDKVLAGDPTGGDKGAREVVALHSNLDLDLTDLTVATPDGQFRTIKTTWHHPFWDATSQRWVDAGELVPGHNLVSSDGAVVRVVQAVNYVGSAPMRDLTVDDLHTYFVMASDATGVLVHNVDAACPFVGHSPTGTRLDPESCTCRPPDAAQGKLTEDNTPIRQEGEIKQQRERSESHGNAVKSVQQGLDGTYAKAETDPATGAILIAAVTAERMFRWAKRKAQ